MQSRWMVAEFNTVRIFFDPFFDATLVVLSSLLAAMVLVLAHRLFSFNLYQAWLVLRQIVGWLLIIIGMLGMILPGPGIPFFVLGVLLVGRRHRLIRRSWVLLRLHLRRLGQRPGMIGRVAQFAYRQIQRTRAQMRPMFRNVSARHHRRGEHRR
ncbi:hypothetical protein [Candidatus Chloroploca asiatica]|uniref:Uncharacterized protein n=1 Tax=Candidatus Chloroploca asiatica TaxID=1506545 RepID=A0A2H3KWB8_9CHLR|nr:hypothetical protein [Candidatus Chloroploca asiatica]PDV98218.1 hypothetical protein A9Q02_16385 [Candidatus Chloroploca asiatica]